MALSIREANDDDRLTILKIVEAAFARADEAAIVEKLWADNAVALDLAAEIDGAIVGHCAFSPVAADPALKGALLGMAPVSVLPGFQNRGVGGAMIETGIDYCRTRGASLVVVLGAPEYYSRFGFAPTSAKNIRWDAMDAGDAFQLIDFADLKQTPQRTIRYHDAFYG